MPAGGSTIEHAADKAGQRQQVAANQNIAQPVAAVDGRDELPKHFVFARQTRGRRRFCSFEYDSKVNLIRVAFGYRGDPKRRQIVNQRTRREIVKMCGLQRRQEERAGVRNFDIKRALVFEVAENAAVLPQPSDSP